MKKSRQIELIFIAVLVSGFAGHMIYDHWDRWFPVFAEGRCLREQRSGRLYHLVKDEYTSALNRGVPVRVLETGVALPGEHAVGSLERISVDNPKLRLVDCPWDKN